MIYAFDFDGTLAVTDYPNIVRPIEKTVTFAKNLKQRGHQIILWTCREGGHLNIALKWCKEQGLEFDAVNDNLEERKAQWDNNCRKIYADYYIDDHNMFMEDVNG